MLNGIIRRFAVLSRTRKTALVLCALVVSVGAYVFIPVRLPGYSLEKHKVVAVEHGFFRQQLTGDYDGPMPGTKGFHNDYRVYEGWRKLQPYLTYDNPGVRKYHGMFYFREIEGKVFIYVKPTPKWSGNYRDIVLRYAPANPDITKAADANRAIEVQTSVTHFPAGIMSGMEITFPEDTKGVTFGANGFNLFSFSDFNETLRRFFGDRDIDADPVVFAESLVDFVKRYRIYRRGSFKISVPSTLQQVFAGKANCGRASNVASLVANSFGYDAYQIYVGLDKLSHSVSVIRGDDKEILFDTYWGVVLEYKLGTRESLPGQIAKQMSRSYDRVNCAKPKMSKVWRESSASWFSEALQSGRRFLVGNTLSRTELAKHHFDFRKGDRLIVDSRILDVRSPVKQLVYPPEKTKGANYNYDSLAVLVRTNLGNDRDGYEFKAPFAIKHMVLRGDDLADAVFELEKANGKKEIHRGLAAANKSLKDWIGVYSLKISKAKPDSLVVLMDMGPAMLRLKKNFDEGYKSLDSRYFFESCYQIPTQDDKEFVNVTWSSKTAPEIRMLKDVELDEFLNRQFKSLVTTKS